MKECPFNTTEINKIAVWFCVPIEILETALIEFDTVNDRNFYVLYKCGQYFRTIVDSMNMSTVEDTRYDMFVILTNSIIKCTPPINLDGFSKKQMQLLLDKLLEKANEIQSTR